MNEIPRRNALDAAIAVRKLNFALTYSLNGEGSCRLAVLTGGRLNSGEEQGLWTMVTSIPPCLGG